MGGYKYDAWYADSYLKPYSGENPMYGSIRAYLRGSSKLMRSHLCPHIPPQQTTNG